MTRERLNQLVKDNGWEDDPLAYLDLLEEWYTKLEIERGFKIVSDKKGHGALRVKAIPELGICKTDEDAAKYAEKCGVAIIRDCKLVKHHRAYYLDTVENRELLKELIQF